MLPEIKLVWPYLPVNTGEQELVAIGHVPMNFHFCCANFWPAMDAACSLQYMPTGPRYLEDGLVVPRCRFKAMSNEKALIYILKNELEKR